MILHCTKNRDTEVWYLDLTGALARPPASPTIYALVSYEAPEPRYYVGSSKRFTARMSAHFSFARSTKLRGHSAGGQLFAPVVARRQRALVIVLETCPGASTAALMRCEQAWIIAARRDCGEKALAYQVPATTAPLRGPHAPATLALRRLWPSVWVEALGSFFREPRRPARGAVLPGKLSASKRPAAAPKLALAGPARKRRKSSAGTGAAKDAEATGPAA